MTKKQTKPINSIHELYFNKELFCADIKKKRNELNLSYYKLGQIIAYDSTGLKYIEEGRYYPTMETYCRIIRWLDVDANRYINRVIE
jgi:DNA-binding XRE family transcriptional regulator